MNAKRKSIWLFVAMIVCIPLITFSIARWYESRIKALPYYGKDAAKITSFNFMNQSGKNITEKSWSGKIVVVNFFFSHCPIICPKMIRNLKMVQEAFVDDSMVLINSLSVDPVRDSVERLTKFASEYGIKTEGWNLLTGDKAEIYHLARKSFLVTATDGDGGAADFIHSDRLVLLDKSQKIRGYYDGTNVQEVKQLILDIQKLREEN
ncbi:MAG: SCO family protein [Bacteroidetes bacterium]|nr:MAG: SCO family protein [Bacteroidota bacterium]